MSPPLCWDMPAAGVQAFRSTPPLNNQPLSLDEGARFGRDDHGRGIVLAVDLAATIMNENMKRWWAVAHSCGTAPLVKLQAMSVAKSACFADVLLHCEPKGEGRG